MQRRGFIALLGGAATWPLTARAQQPTVPVRIGFLSGGSPTSGQNLVDCFRGKLQEFGWVEGKNIEIQYRWTEGASNRFSVLATELVRLNPRLIVATSTPGAQSVKAATGDIPVVFMAVSDPVASGIVASLARPGGNITGVSNFLPATTGKLIELLKMVSISVSRIAILHNPTNPGKLLEVQELQGAAKISGLSVKPVELRSRDDLSQAFSTISQSRCEALIVLQDGITLANSSDIIGYAETTKLPAIYQIREYVDAGGLMSYGLNYCEHYRRGATYVDKILKGAKPVDLPVELPTTFELVVNLKAAKAIGFNVPPSLLARADEVIE